MKKIISFALILVMTAALVAAVVPVNALAPDGDVTYARITASGGDPYFYAHYDGDITIDVTKAKFASIKYRSDNAGSPAKIEIYASSPVGGSPSAPLNHDGNWNTVVMDISNCPNWDGSQWGSASDQQLRLDPLDGSVTEGMYIDIAWVALFETEAQANAFDGTQTNYTAIITPAHMATEGARNAISSITLCNAPVPAPMNEQGRFNFRTYTATGGDPFMVCTFNDGKTIDCDTMKWISVRYRLNASYASRNLKFQLYPDAAAGLGKVEPFPYVDGEWHDMVFSMEGVINWNNTANTNRDRLRIDWIQEAQAGDQMDLAWVAVFRNEADARAYNGLQTTPAAIVTCDSKQNYLAAPDMTGSGDNAYYFMRNFSAVSLSLSDNIAVNFKLNKIQNTMGRYIAPHVKVNFKGEEFDLTTYTESSDYYVFSFTDISPEDVNENITATLWATKNCGDDVGTVHHSEPVTYSIKKYCDNQIGSSAGSNLKALCYQMLDYGQATKNYINGTNDAVTGYDASLNVAYDSPTAATGYIDNTSRFDPAGLTTGTVKWKAASLRLEDSISLKLKFYVPTGTTAAAVKYTVGTGVNAGAEQTITSADFLPTGGDANGRFYTVYLKNINPSQMRELVSVKIVDGTDADLSRTLNYSIATYVKNMENDGAVGNLVKAIMRYGDAAAAYVADPNA